MQKLTFYGWQGWQRPEAFTLLLCQLTPLGLAKARVIVQQVLQGELVTLELPEHIATRVHTQSEALGVQCQLG